MTTQAERPWPAAPGAGPLGDGRFAEACSKPESAEELCRQVVEHARHGLAIYPQGGGTALDYGDPPARPGAIIDTRSLGRVIDYPHADMTITVEAGMIAAEVQSILADKKQRLLVDIPQADRATLGGVFATNTCGPRRFGVGRPRDQIIGVSFVTAAGVEVKGGGRVVKNVAGYDFPKLLSGSLGTLGILTQMTLKVRPIPEVSTIVWVPVEALAAVSEILDQLNLSDSRPIAIELLNDRAITALGPSVPSGAAPWVVAIGLEDNASSVRWQVSRLQQELGRAELRVLEDGEAVPVWSALTEFQALEPGALACTVALPPSRVVPFLERMDLSDWAVQSHAGSGIVRLQAIGEWDFERASTELERIRALAIEGGGSLVVSRCPAEWKPKISVWGPRRSDWVVAERVKRALDPESVLNPGRFVGNL